MDVPVQAWGVFLNGHFANTELEDVMLPCFACTRSFSGGKCSMGSARPLSSSFRPFAMFRSNRNCMILDASWLHCLQWKSIPMEPQYSDARKKGNFITNMCLSIEFEFVAHRLILSNIIGSAVCPVLAETIE
eukprot:6476356-Amphidinium_carterae.1